jgi:DNA-binding CsgD family transcriptional regulator
VYAQDAAARILMRDRDPQDMPELTARELECLRWTMEGKTAWELGIILGISEQTAARHINNATQKLGCNNKVQAVVKALRRGLIR